MAAFRAAERNGNEEQCDKATADAVVARMRARLEKLKSVQVTTLVSFVHASASVS